MAYPFKKYNYKVEIDGITEASFSEVSGFDASIDVIEYNLPLEENFVRNLIVIKK